MTREGRRDESSWQDAEALCLGQLPLAVVKREESVRFEHDCRRNMDNVKSPDAHLRRVPTRDGYSHLPNLRSELLSLKDPDAEVRKETVTHGTRLGRRPLLQEHSELACVGEFSLTERRQKKGRPILAASRVCPRRMGISTV